MTNVWPKLAVGAIVIDEGKRILLVERRFPPAAGWWSIPGGHVEKGESLEEATLRELEEETGLKGDIVKPLALTEYIAREGNTIKYHYVIFDFLVKPLGGSLRPDHESTNVGFFNLLDALEMKITITTRKLLHVILTEGLEGKFYHLKTDIDLREYRKEVELLKRREKYVITVAMKKGWVK
jgi:8-oxo-dGTP diphosphatase